MLLNCIAVGVGGFVGAIMRYLISLVPMQQNGNYPINTFITNIAGAILIGFIIVHARNTDMSPEKLLMLKTGLCGGLTTFSTFSVETWGLIETGNYLMAAGYAIFSVLLCAAGVVVGMKLAVIM